ncbi:MAG: hypothetical protein NT007_09675 [Candidatus Kapabacteria bacterium]|nr:hypothetical protein [Candidatus Kapabacteria bacterium]
MDYRDLFGDKVVEILAEFGSKAGKKTEFVVEKFNSLFEKLMRVAKMLGLTQDEVERVVAYNMIVGLESQVKG